MEKELPKWVVRRLWRAVIEFDLLGPGDKVMAGFSGGKDSAFMLIALSQLRQNTPFVFDLAALHLDQGFPEEMDTGPMQDLCRDLGIPFFIQRAEIYKAAASQQSQSPCARCSFLRRGVINRFAREQGFNKVAYAHHLDDAVETFLMSQLYSGQVKTFKPSTFLDRSEITLIRPLVYFRESEVAKALTPLGYNPVDTPCPFAHSTMRAVVKKLLGSLCSQNQMVFDNLVSAMRAGAPTELWPPEPGKDLLRGKIKHFWKGKN